MASKNVQKSAPKQRLTKAYKNFFECVDMDFFQMLCAGEPPDSKFGRIWTLLDDPRFQRMSPATLVQRSGIKFPDLVEFYSEGAHAKAHMHSLHKLPEVVAENAVDALPTKVTCPQCDGHKRVDEPTGKTNKAGYPLRVRCPNCAGMGQVRQAGEMDAKKLMFQHEKLIGDGGGRVSVGVNVGLGIPSLMDAVDAQERALKLEAKVVDAKVVEE